MNALLRFGTCLFLLCFCLQARAIDVGTEAPSLGALRVINPEAYPETPFIGLKGNVTLIDFWATWCGPCVESIPHWNELAGEFAPQGVQFLAITDENEALVRRFLKRTPIKSWVGVEGPGQSLRDLYGISGIPTTVIINKQGVVVAVTHPIQLQARHIQEVLATGNSSLRPLAKNDAAPQENPGGLTKTVSATNASPLLELSVKRSAPREPGRGFNMWSGNPGQTEINGEYATVESALLNFFKIRKAQLDLRTQLPADEYDFKVRLPIAEPADRAALFTAFFKTSFGLHVSRKTELRDVWVATRISTNATGLSTPVPGGQGGGGEGRGSIDLRRGKIPWVLGYFEGWLGKTVMDETHDTNTYDIHLRWELSKAELALHEADRQIVQSLFSSDADAEKKLNADQQQILQAMRGKLSQDEMAKLPADKREEYTLIAKELAKPEDDRFKPSPETILTLAREQLGLELKPAQRPMDILVVNAEN